MKTLKIGFFFSGLFFLLACGESPSAEQASATMTPAPAPAAVAVSTDVTTTEEEIASANNQIAEAEEALKAEVMEDSAPTEEVAVEEMDYSNVENPQPKKKVVVKPLRPAEANVEIKESIAKEMDKPVVPVTEPNSDATPPKVKEIIKEIPKVETPAPEVKEEIIPEFNHDAFDVLLKKHVSSVGKVNYQSFKAEEAKLDAYLKTLENTSIASDWSRSKQMAYYINAYNAATIKLILKNWPVKSITDLHGGKPWDVKWVKLGGKTYSLNNIENDILRPKYNDARIHFAVNCAAKSCPPLLNKAWTAGNLNKYLDLQARSFINNPTFNAIKAGNVEISKIFDWYAADFGDITDYLNKYAKVTIDDNAKVQYKEYNWSLNN